MRTHIITVLVAAAAVLAACDSGSSEPAAKADTAVAPVEAVPVAQATPTSVAAGTAVTPADGEAGLTKLLDKAKVCSDTASEMGDNEEQNTELMNIWAETGCPALEAETAASLQVYSGNAEVTAKIKNAVEPLGY